MNTSILLVVKDPKDGKHSLDVEGTDICMQLAWLYSERCSEHANSLFTNKMLVVKLIRHKYNDSTLIPNILKN